MDHVHKPISVFKFRARSCRYKHSKRAREGVDEGTGRQCQWQEEKEEEAHPRREESLGSGVCEEAHKKEFNVAQSPVGCESYGNDDE
jgi:hypothetical protein